MNSLRRMLDILDLFGPEQPVIDVETICTRLGYAPASAYRYVRELGDVGLLVRLPRGYALGPRVIELDRQMSEYNPVIVHSRDLLQHLVDETGMNALLSELYGDTVITLLLLSGSEAQALQFGRGRPMHLFRSATARIILAHLSPRHLRRIYDQHAHEPDVQRLGATWREFSKGMLELRRQGYCITHGELDEGRVGLAAPIFDEKQRVLGGVTLVGSEARFAAYQQTYLATLVTEAAKELTRRIGNQ